jgi:hypothetical protein
MIIVLYLASSCVKGALHYVIYHMILSQARILVFTLCVLTHKVSHKASHKENYIES